MRPCTAIATESTTDQDHRQPIKDDGSDQAPDDTRFRLYLFSTDAQRPDRREIGRELGSGRDSNIERSADLPSFVMI
jgi:hypothetical protein